MEFSSSCFHKVDILLQVAILPYQTVHCIGTVKKQLNDSLFSYNEKLGGIPISYSDLEFPKGKEYGRIFYDQPWVHVDVNTSVVLFKPAVGARLTGKISKVSDNHVSLLVLGMFNATLSSDEMHKFYSFDYTLKSWVSSSRELSEGDQVDFDVASFQHSSGVVNIVGRLVNE